MTYTLVVPKELLSWLVKARAENDRRIRERMRLYEVSRREIWESEVQRAFRIVDVRRGQTEGLKRSAPRNAKHFEGA